MLGNNDYSQKLKNLVKQTLINSATKNGIKENKKIYVTDLVGCIRRSYYIKKYGFQVDESTALWLLFGGLFHDLITPAIAEAFKGQKEVSINYKFEDVEIHGRVDVLLDDSIIELKTCSKLPIKPKLSHVEQLNVYMNILNKKIGYLVYISKVQADTVVFECEKNHRMFQQTLEKAKLLKKALDNDIPPEVNLPLSARRQFCDSCPFYEKCTSDTVAELLELGLI